MLQLSHLSSDYNSGAAQNDNSNRLFMVPYLVGAWSMKGIRTRSFHCTHTVTHTHRLTHTISHTHTHRRWKMNAYIMCTWYTEIL